MICSKCGGTGEANMSNGTFAWKVECDECCGGGIVAPLTEQEYIQFCDTEQLIRFLLWYPQNVFGYPKPKMSIAEEEDAIREWLKQPHKE